MSFFVRHCVLLPHVTPSDCIDRIRFMQCAHGLDGQVRQRCFVLHVQIYKVEKVVSVVQGRVCQNGTMKLTFRLHTASLCVSYVMVVCSALMCICAAMVAWPGLSLAAAMFVVFSAIVALRLWFGFSVSTQQLIELLENYTAARILSLK